MPKGIINAKPRLKRLFRLRTILLVVMLSILFLPLGSLYFFRFYENDLVRKTETELISQSAVLASVYRELLGKNAIDNPFFYTPIQPQLDLSKDKILPRRPETRPLKNTNNNRDYLIAKKAGLRMLRILRNTQQFTLAGMRILDRNGTVVSGQSELGTSLAHVFEIKKALKGEYTSVIRERISDEPPPSIASISRGTGIRVFTAFPIMNGDTVYGVVYLSRTPQNILKNLYSIKEKVILFTLLLLGLTGLIVLFISSRLSRPIRELIDQTQKVTKGELEKIEVLRQPGTYELAKLSNSFAEMSEALNERSRYIQEFASHVSHEFKTPLTSMQGGLELLQEHKNNMSAEQQQRFINNLQEDTQRLKALVNRLLEQARADSLQSSTEVTNLLAALDVLKGRYKELNLDIIFNEADDTFNSDVQIGKNALQSVMGNLCDNSLQHGASKIELSVSIENKHIHISFQDNGTGISEANQNKIFTPFFTTRRETGGTGLGLGIVESILKASNGQLRYKPSNSSDKKGALFVISLLKI